MPGVYRISGSRPRLPMIIALLSDIERASSSAWRGLLVDSGRGLFGLGLVDHLDIHVVRLFVVGRGSHVQIGVAVGLLALGRPERALNTGDEVPKHFLADHQAALKLGDSRGRSLEQDDVVRAFAMMVDRISQSPAAPRGLLDDLTTTTGDRAGSSLERTLDLVVRQIGTQNEHKFVSAHAPRTPSHGIVPMHERQRRSVGTERRANSIRDACSRAYSPDGRPAELLTVTKVAVPKCCTR